MDPPDNAALTALLSALHEAPEHETEHHLRPLLEALLASTLITGEDEEGLFIVDLDEGDFLALFTDPIELHMFEPNSRRISIRGEDAIKRIAEDEFDGLIVNPAGRSFELSREDVLDFFEID